MQLKVEYVPIDTIQPYAGNAKLHPKEQIEQIKNSIKEFGFDDPIAIWNGEIVEGHGRYIAAQELDIDTVPVIRLDHLTDAQRRAYNIAHNKLTMNSGFNFDLLQLELESLELDMTDFGFNEAELLELMVNDEEEVNPNPVPQIPHGYTNNDDTSRNDVGTISAGGVFAPTNDNTQGVSKEDLEIYEQHANTLITKRVILVYRTDEEEAFIKRMLNINQAQPLNVVYNVSDVIRMEEDDNQ